MNTENTEMVETTEETTPVVEVILPKKLGRPVVTNSARQQKLAKREAAIAENGGVKRGRPASANSKRAAQLAERQAKIEAGIVIKPGRPKMVKPEVAPVVESEAPEATEVVAEVQA